MMRNLIAVLFVALLAACAPPFDRPAFLASFVGQPETELVRRLGVPVRVFETNGHRFLAYVEQRSEVQSVGFGVGGGFGYFGPSFGYYPSQVIERGCETTFEVADGRVLTWSLRGNAC
jgi:hypothetical protein